MAIIKNNFNIRRINKFMLKIIQKELVYFKLKKIKHNREESIIKKIIMKLNLVEVLLIIFIKGKIIILLD